MKKFANNPNDSKGTTEIRNERIARLEAELVGLLHEEEGCPCGGNPCPCVFDNFLDELESRLIRIEKKLDEISKRNTITVPVSHPIHYPPTPITGPSVIWYGTNAQHTRIVPLSINC